VRVGSCVARPTLRSGSPRSTRTREPFGSRKRPHAIVKRAVRSGAASALVWRYVIQVGPTQGVGLVSAAIRRYVIPVGPTQGVVPPPVSRITPIGGIVRGVFPVFYVCCRNRRRRLDCDCTGQRRPSVGPPIIATVSGATTPIAIVSFEALIVIRLSRFYFLFNDIRQMPAL
jgi:hypothetical protein